MQSGSIQDGLRVTGGRAVISNAAGSQTSFQGNANGIEVTLLGSVGITGTPGAPVPSNNGTVLLPFNVTGLRIAQTPGSAISGLNDVTGAVIWGSSMRDILLSGGSKMKLRGSVVGGGPEGIRINSNGGSDAGSSISQMDFGTATDFGNNYIQTPNGANAVHSTAGICLNLQIGHPPQTLFAAGNYMTTMGNPGTQLNCATATGAGTVYRGTNCNANQRWSIGNTNTGAGSTPVTYVLDMCN